MWLKLEEITPDNLDLVAAQWEEQRIDGLVRDSMVSLGHELRQKRDEQAQVEMRAKIRAMKLYNQHGFAKREIADLLGVDPREVTKWLK